MRTAIFITPGSEGRIVDFGFTDDQQNIRDAVLKHCSQFSDEYWLAQDHKAEFPFDFYKSMADAGWLGVAMLALGVTGLVLWWPKRGQWKYAFLVRRTAKGLRFHRELHAATGIWIFVVS